VLEHLYGGAIEHESAAESDAREERLARNEVLFRSVNERIQQQALSFGGSDTYEFICECSAAACVERVTLTLIEYERVRNEGTHFFVLPGHEDVTVELVIAQQPSFLVVQKDGPAGVVAELEDPRDGDLA
jgi:hypothetical protein